MRVRFRLLILLAVVGPCAPQQITVSQEMYLLAATPTVYRGIGYPATLYHIDPKKELRAIRQIVPASTGVEFVLAGAGFLAIGQPHLAANTLSFIHYAAPLTVDSVYFSKEVGADPLGAFLVRDLFGHHIVAVDVLRDGKRLLLGILPDPGKSNSRVDPLTWPDLQRVEFEGSIGGADPGFGTFFPTLNSEGLYDFTPQGLVFIGRLKTPAATVEPDTPATLLCANEEFVAASRNSVDPSVPDSTKLWIYNRRLQTGFSLVIPGDRNRYRIFGKRLAVVVSYSGEGPTSTTSPKELTSGTRITTYSSSSGASDPGEDQQRADGTTNLPPVRSFYHYPAMKQWFPGKLLVVDLSTHEKVAYDTAQADSEILYTDDQKVLYRVNDELYLTRISQGVFEFPALLVKDEHVPEIHWVFWGPPL
jgi:hypothetical protein